MAFAALASPASPAGTKTPDSITGCKSPPLSPGSPIKDDACPICLGSITDKCAAESCFHNFCFVCLKEWSKQKPVCPLCKQPFKKILYDIKSETDYKEFEITYHSSNSRGIRPPRFAFADMEILQNFYDDTSQFSPFLSYVIPPLRGGHPRRRHDRASSAYRLSRYLDNMWVQPLADITGQYRESSPQLYQEQPALTHRLLPWLHREVMALVPPSRISDVTQRIMNWIEQYPINSREFRRNLRPHFGSRTRHFIHEFYHFARSPFDMVGHDLAAHYTYRMNMEGGDLEVNQNKGKGGCLMVESVVRRCAR